MSYTGLVVEVDVTYTYAALIVNLSFLGGYSI